MPGFIGLPGYRMSVPCEILNVSAMGASVGLVHSRSRIRLAEHLPDQIVLVFASERVEISGTIRWRAG